VYSSAGSAITDPHSNATVAGHSLAEPQAIWFALWDNGKNMTGAPYMTSAVWPVASRSKQYAGNRVVKVGGISLNIDADWVAGGRSEVTGGSPISTGRIQFAMTGPDS